MKNTGDWLSAFEFVTVFRRWLTLLKRIPSYYFYDIVSLSLIYTFALYFPCKVSWNPIYIPYILYIYYILYTIYVCYNVLQSVCYIRYNLYVGPT